MRTAVGNATNTMDVVINKAKAQADADINKNEAQMTSLEANIKNQAQAYANLKQNLVMTNA